METGCVRREISKLVVVFTLQDLICRKFFDSYQELGERFGQSEYCEPFLLRTRDFVFLNLEVRQKPWISKHAKFYCCFVTVLEVTALEPIPELREYPKGSRQTGSELVYSEGTHGLCLLQSLSWASFRHMSQILLRVLL